MIETLDRSAWHTIGEMDTSTGTVFVGKCEFRIPKDCVGCTAKIVRNGYGSVAAVFLRNENKPLVRILEKINEEINA